MRRVVQFAMNPKTRKYARKFGARAGYLALRAVNRRRMARGRRVIWDSRQYANRPAIRSMLLDSRGFLGKDRGMRTMTTTVAAPPLRNNTTTVGKSSSEYVVSSEVINENVLSLEDDVHEPTYFHVHPLQECLWPVLKAKANNYDNYDCMGLQFVYQPTQGTGYGGSLTMAWTKQSQLTNTEFNNSLALREMPVHVNGSVSQPLTLTVSPADMAQLGRGMVMPRSDVEIQDYTRYFLGNLYLLPYNCDTAGATLGTLSVNYRFMLKSQRPDFNTQVGLFTHATDTATQGAIAYEVDESTTTGFVMRYRSLRPVVLMVIDSTPGTITIKEDGVVSTAPYYYCSGGGKSIQFYYLGRKTGEHEVDFSLASGTFERFALMAAPQGILAA